MKQIVSLIKIYTKKKSKKVFLVLTVTEIIVSFHAEKTVWTSGLKAKKQIIDLMENTFMLKLWHIQKDLFVKSVSLQHCIKETTLHMKANWTCLTKL